MANLQKIRAIADEKKITIAQLAAEIGITQQALLKIIRENSTKIETLERISNILKVSPAVFFEDELTKSIIQVTKTGDNMYNSTKTVDYSLALKEKDEHIKDLQSQIKDLRDFIDVLKNK